MVDHQVTVTVHWDRSAETVENENPSQTFTHTHAVTKVDARYLGGADVDCRG
jgi:hypothetical protein